MWTRRAGLLGLFAAIGQADRAASQASSASFQLRIFIPSPAVSYLGDAFSGGDKVVLDGKFDLSKPGPESLSISRRYLGPTDRYAPEAVEAVAGRPSWFVRPRPGMQPVERGQAILSNRSLAAHWFTPAGATHGVRIVAEAANPLVAGSPAIDAAITLGLRRRDDDLEYSLEAEHDGFPSYSLTVGSRTVLNYDCVVAQDSPLGLFPPMERHSKTAWRRL